MFLPYMMNMLNATTLSNYQCLHILEYFVTGFGPLSSPQSFLESCSVVEQQELQQRIVDIEKARGFAAK